MHFLIAESVDFLCVVLITHFSIFLGVSWCYFGSEHLQGSKNLFSASGRVFRAENGRYISGRICFIVVAIVRQEKADKKPTSKLRAKNERKEKEKINESHHEKRDTDDIASF